MNAQNQMQLNSNSEGLVEIQDQVQMFENLHLKNEFIRAMRNYTLMVFSSGDFNKIKQLMMKYSLIETKQNKRVNKDETVTQLLGYFDVETCQENGIDPETFTTFQKQKKIRSKIISEGQKKFCGGIEKEQIFKQCVLPVLMTICENESVNMIDLVNQIIQQVELIKSSNSGDEDEEMEDEGSNPSENLLKGLEGLKNTNKKPELIEIKQPNVSNQQLEQEILKQI